MSRGGSVRTKRYDAVVIGAGAAGMGAATVIAGKGNRVALLDREEHPGGILLQCIHNGFGLHRFKQELTGPEYAEEVAQRLTGLPVDLYLESTAVELVGEPESKRVIAYSCRHGVLDLRTRAVVLAMGCRERNRGTIGIPGTRPAGIFTAGLAQRLLNIEGCIPGTEVVIVGSGDIGLIMARRLRWVGSTVRCVVEILPHPSGLTRNIVQCLRDFSIPLYLSHSVTGIFGRDRVEGVEIAPLAGGAPQTHEAFTVPCDTVLLSVGLVPENELTRAAGAAISPATNGPVVDHTLQTSIEGVFACGNVLHVHDLVDFVSREAEECGEHVAAYLRRKRRRRQTTVPVAAGANVKYVVPNRCVPGRGARFLLRSLVTAERATVTIRQGRTVIRSRRLRHVHPAEMIAVEVTAQQAGRMAKGTPVEIGVEREEKGRR